MHFGQGTHLGDQLRQRAENLGLAPSMDSELKTSDPMRPHAHLRLLLLFPLDFPKDPPIIRLVGPLLEEGTGGVQFGAFVNKLLYGPVRRSEPVEDSVDVDRIKVKDPAGSGEHNGGTSQGNEAATGLNTPASQLWGS